jgi:hypothetical protein
MAITLDPKTEARLRERAAEHDLSVGDYIERLLRAEEGGEEELRSLALDGLRSGEPIQPGLTYWDDKHRRLDARLIRES